MSGNFIYRHHVEPRVKLYSPNEESFPIPLKYIDVSRTTHTNLDVKQERCIDDYWNIDGSRDLSDSWITMKQMFDISEKLITEQSDEIYGVNTINWEDSHGSIYILLVMKKSSVSCTQRFTYLQTL